MLLYVGVLVLLVGGIAVTARWPSWSFTLLYPALWPFWATYLPFVDGRPERVFGALGIAGAVFMARRRHLPFGLPKLVATGSILLFVGFTASWLRSGDLSGGLPSLVGIVTRVLFLFLVYALVQRRRDLELAARFYIGAGLLSAMLAVWVSAMYGFGFTRVEDQTSGAMSDLGVNVVSAAYSANFNTVAGVLLLVLAPTVRRRANRTLTIILSAVCFSSAFIAQFRREILLTIPIVLVLLALDRAVLVRRTAVIFLIAGTLGFLFLVYPNSPVIQARLAEETDESLRGEDIRSVSFIAGVKSFGESPFIGVGPGNFSVASVKQLSGYAENMPFQQAFNTFLSVAVEAGITGLVGVLLVLYGVWSSVRRVRSGVYLPEDQMLRASPSLLAIIVIWFTFGNAYELSQPWFLMGLMLSAARLKQNTAREEQLHVRNARLVRPGPVLLQA